jgi:hypothetical protein
MGAGCRFGPDRYRQTSQACDQNRSSRQFRHQHADDEQRIRHLHVVVGRLSFSFTLPRQSQKSPHQRAFSLAHACEPATKVIQTGQVI